VRCTGIPPIDTWFPPLTRFENSSMLLKSPLTPATIAGACCLYRKPKVTGSKGWCLNTSTRKYEFQCNAKGPSNEGRGSSRTIGRAEETFNN
jgi:hypothetical protein